MLRQIYAPIVERPLEIVVADDDITDVFMLREAFSAANIRCHVRHLKAGQDTIAFLEGLDWSFKSTLPGLIVLDQHLPDCKGIDVLRYIQSHPELSGIPVMLLSGVFREDERRDAIKEGARCFEKPFALNEWKELALTFQGFCSETEMASLAVA